MDDAQLSWRELGVTEAKAADLHARMRRVGLEESDLSEKFVTGSGPGGQKVNRTSNVVQLTHDPTEKRVTASQGRSRALNRFFARRRLVELMEKEMLGKDSPQDRERERIRKQKARRARRSRRKRA